MQQSTTPLLIGEFKITVGGKWTKLLSYIALACLSIYIGWLIIVSESGLVAKYIAFLFFSAIACVFVFKVIDAFFHKLIIRQQSLILKKWVSNDIIYFKDIAGYRIEHDAFYIVHTDSTREPIRIPRNLERSDRVRQWLNQNFTDLEPAPEFSPEATSKADLDEILSNPDFGRTRLEREARLKNIKKLTRFIGWISFGLFFWVGLYPKPYELSLLVTIFFPIAACGLAMTLPGLIKTMDAESDPYPSISSAISIPACTLMLRALLDFELLHYYEWLWYALGFVAVCMAVVIMYSTKDIRFKKWDELVGVTLLSFWLYMYLFGTYIIVNCQFDQTKTETFNVRVENKRITEKKRTTYYLTLEPWGPRSSSENVSVSSTMFEQVAVGDTIHVHLSQGQLKTSWFYVSRK